MDKGYAFHSYDSGQYNDQSLIGNSCFNDDPLLSAVECAYRQPDNSNSGAYGPPESHDNGNEEAPGSSRSGNYGSSGGGNPGGHGHPGSNGSGGGGGGEPPGRGNSGGGDGDPPPYGSTYAVIQEPIPSRTPAHTYCVYPECKSTFSRPADLARHLRAVHFVRLIDCPWPKCDRKGSNGFTRDDHLKEHRREFHHEDIPQRKKRPAGDGQRRSGR